MTEIPPSQQHQQTSTKRGALSINAASREEFCRVLEEFRPFLTAIVLAELPVSMRCKFGASDIVQESIVRGMEIASTFKGTTRQELASWLRAIVAGCLANHRRKYRSKKRNVELEVATDSRLINPKEQSPVEATLTQEKRKDLEEALSRLPEDYRNSIVWRHWDNLSFAEIGCLTGKSEDAARKMWKRAVNQLKKEMERHESGQP